MPKKYNTPHRNMTVKTRLTKEEYATFAEVATLCGVSKAAFIRKAITGATLKPTTVTTSVNDELLKKLEALIAQYGKIGGNLNQIARHLNEFGTPYADLEKEVRDAAVDLAMLKYEVLEKMAEAMSLCYLKLLPPVERKPNGSLPRMTGRQRQRACHAHSQAVQRL